MSAYKATISFDNQFSEPLTLVQHVETYGKVQGSFPATIGAGSTAGPVTIRAETANNGAVGFVKYKTLEGENNVYILIWYFVNNNARVGASVSSQASVASKLSPSRTAELEYSATCTVSEVTF